MSAIESTPDAIRLTVDRTLLRGVVVAVVAGLFLALSGVFETGDAPLWIRLAYWLPIMVLGSLWGHLCSRYVERFVALDERPWLTVLVLTAIMWVPMSLIVWAVTGVVFLGRVHDLGALPVMAFYVLIVTAPMSALGVFLGRSRPVQTHAAPPGAAAPVRFLDRLPLKLKGATIRAVAAEDHYLRIHTDRGSDLILMRFADALVELEGLEGAQVHRSWWVSRDAVRGVARGDGRATLTLDGDIEAPVSRRYARALRAAGWY